MSEQAPQGYYAASAKPSRPFPRLAGALKTDICIVGGGYTGLHAALALAAAGAQPVLIEAETIGFGASGRNGGQIHTGLNQSQAALEKWLGLQHARDLWILTEESKALVRQTIARHGIDCGLRDGLVIAAHNKRSLPGLIEDTEYLAKHYRYDCVRMMDAQETAQKLGTDIYHGGRFDLGGGHLHPLDYARGLAAAADDAGASIWEHSRALALEDSGAAVTIRCESGTITADKVLLACDAFTGKIAPKLERYMGYVESFITATEPLPPHLAETVLPCGAAVADTRHVLDYYRKSREGRMLYAGRESYFSVPADIASLVRPRMLATFPQLRDVKIEYAWSGAVGITATRMPHLGALSERIFFAHGYSGQGVALTSIGGKLMAEAATGNRERFDVFARVPVRAIPGGKYFKQPLVSLALYGLKLMDSL
ncbi:MAG: FAD-binding oxidoreductase [Alphaproteobacteria bacterium]|nr:FAD-binding oxidoreductase [Alphaproteobacteria bacterium]MBU6471151.1 FAD-binding oxidoreductase [Alphaproteobacteria bacterium]MDE2013106.1 FAD-binding oxidoreductase [Alphaproteobacteria bacterium]MDE2074401.1 FAD-binding oxidoreductase [Alphaproteobacteria bacterium]MDE2351926.1 FAD-binding oxidoreductase [Alphaproteobacteria bacterium]